VECGGGATGDGPDESAVSEMAARLAVRSSPPVVAKELTHQAAVAVRLAWYTWLCDSQQQRGCQVVHNPEPQATSGRGSPHGSEPKPVQKWNEGTTDAAYQAKPASFLRPGVDSA
jgi:hypothetical protein